MFLLTASFSGAFAQDCSILAPGSDAGFDQMGFCAPVTGRVKYFTFYTLTATPKSQLKVRVNWGMGDPSVLQYEVDSLGYDDNLKAWVYRMPEATFKYEASRLNPKCSYPVTVQAMVNNKVCSSPKQAGTVIVWDKDDANGGNLLFSPVKYYVCAGSEVNLEFEDKSIWNCVPDQEKAHINWPSRSTQFVYGTLNTISGAVKVGEIPVNAIPLEGDINTHPEKAQKPSDQFSKTAKITIPATARPGEQFEVTLNNWNYCNQWPEAPVREKAIIEIVAAPVGTITVQNKGLEDALAFCPNTEVNLSGSYDAALGLVAPEDVRYDWEILDMATGEVVKYENKQKVKLPSGFPNPGSRKVSLKVSNRKANTGICESISHQMIELIDAPSVTSFLNEEQTNKLEFCAEDPSSVSFPLKFKHLFNSREDFSYTYHLYKRNSLSTSPDSALNIRSGTGFKEQERKDSVNFLFTKPGLYRITVVAKNNSTGCSTIQENRVAIYEKPLADFSYEGACAGQPVVFTNKSLASDVPGDKINKWEWDLNYSSENQDQQTFDADKTGKATFTHKFEEAGTYIVALRVTTEAGCSAMQLKTLEIREVPVSVLSSNYAGGLICPGDTLRFTNESLLFNTDALFPAGVGYTLMVSDGVATREVSFNADQPYIDYNSFYNPNDQVEIYQIWLKAQGNEPNTCAANSTAIEVSVRSGAAAAFATTPVYSPFEPNCSPKSFRFVTSKATQALEAERYRWSIVLDGQILEEITTEKELNPAYDTLDYTFLNNGIRFLDYEVILSAEKEGICIMPARNIYRIYPNPVANFSAEPVLLACDSVVFELKVNLPLGISEYNWTFSEAPVNDSETGFKDDNFYIAYSRPAYGEAAKEYTIHLRAKNFYGCEGEWTQTVNVDPVLVHEPRPELLELQGDGCRPLTARFRNNTIGDPAKLRYEFYIENTATASMVKAEAQDIQGNLAGEFSYTFRESGTFNAYLKVIAANGDEVCARPLSAPIVVTVQSDPLVDIRAYPLEACGALTTTITKRIENSSRNIWLVTDTGSGEVIFGPQEYPAGQDPVTLFSFENPTTFTKVYRIEATAWSEAGCSASSATEVTVYPQPKAWFSVEPNVCEPYLVEVNHFTENNAADVEYTWHWGDGTHSEGENPPAHAYSNPSYNIPLYYDIRLIAKSRQGCVADSVIRVKINPKVKAAFEADVQAGCAPLQVQLTNKSQGASFNESGWYVKEEGAPEFAFVGNSIAHYVFENNTQAVKNYQLMFRAQNAGGCADSVTKEIKVLPEMLAGFEITPGNNVYSNEKIVFRNSGILPGITYTWNRGDGSALLVSNEPEVSYAYTNNSLNNHFYEVTLTAEDEVYGCISTVKKTITVYPSLQLSLTARESRVCLPAIPELVPVVKNVSSSYWYTGEKGNVNYSRPLSGVSDPALFPNNTSGPITYEVVYVGVSAEGYKDSTKTEVVVYPEIKPSFTLDGINKNLPKAVFEITNTTPGAENWKTTWEFGNGDFSDKVHPGSYQYPTFGSYTIGLTVSNGLCSETTTMKVTVGDAGPAVSFVMDKTEGCWPVSVQFTNTSEFTDQTSYFWDFGDGIGTSVAVNPSYTYNKAGNYKVTLHAENRTGTENAVTVAEEAVKVYEKPTPDFVVRKENIFVPDEPVYVANYSQRGVWYHWDFGDGTIYEGADQFEPVHYYQEPGEYNIKLVVQTQNGCSDSLLVQKAVIAKGGGKVSIPNGFTPDRSGSGGGKAGMNGKNDVFHPVIKGGVVSYHMQIFNRWGELVFETRDRESGWDGYYKGRLCSSGIYIYKFTAELVDGKTINKVGDVMLIQ